MAFTYDLASADPDTLALSKVRLQLGDTQLNRGVRANGANLSDEELDVFLADEGSDVMRAVAAAAEMLARDWSRVASTAVGPRSAQYGQVAKEWAARAAELREKYGSATGTGGVSFSIAPRRADGYAANAASGEYG